MNIDQFKHAVRLAAQGDVPSGAVSIERALQRKENLRCALALNQFAAACLEVQERGERARCVRLPPELLPPVV